jgi:Ca2+-transporting ATPase
MILENDAFSTIVTAIQEGRIIFDNIRRFVLYLLSCNVSEIMAVSAASFFGIPLPILPLQILFLNLVTDVFPALALGVGQGDPDIMRRPPRDPGEPIIDRGRWWMIGGYGLLMTVCVLASLLLGLEWLGLKQKEAVTISFLTLAFTQLWHVFNMRAADSRIFRNDITGNSYVWGALGLCTVLLICAVYLPGLSDALKVVPPGRNGWLLVAVMSFIPLVVGQAVKVVSAARGASS